MSSLFTAATPSAPDTPSAQAAAPRGEITIRVAQVLRHTDEVSGFVLQRVDGQALPACEAGAHIDVYLPGDLVRSYSLCGDPARSPASYEIAVKREDRGRGGSRAVHSWVREGEILRIGRPRNLFPLAAQAPHHLLLGGGIGMTPMVAMAHALHARGAPFTFAVFARSAGHLPLQQVLETAPWRDRVQIHFDDAPVRTSPASLVAAAPTGTHAYCCGPEGFMQHVREACQHWPAERVHFEYFSAPPQDAAASAAAPAAAGFEVVLARSQKRLTVGPDQNIAHVLQGAGVRVDTVCEQGICGSCITPYIDGTPDHQDFCLSEDERATHVAICCSRSRTPTLTLDL